MWVFGDGFDCYAAVADMDDGYWDSISNVANYSIITGRFSGSQGLASTAGNMLKTSGSNDEVHHISVAIQQTAAITGSTLGWWFTFGDGATNQCSVVFRSDGALLLAAGASNGTVLATYTGALTASNTWYQFEIEVRVSNTAGYMTVRKLGNTSADFTSATNLDTSANTNNYANRLTIGGAASQQIDDLLWRSDSVANGVPWTGDIRCFTRRPSSDVAVAWTKSATSYSQNANGIIGAGSLTPTANQIVYIPFTAAYTGSVGSLTVTVQTTSAANFKCALYNNAGSGGSPGTVLGTATPFSAPGVGTYTINFPTPVAVTAGSIYWIGIGADAASGQFRLTNAAIPNHYFTNSAYATFPVNNPSVTVSNGTDYYFVVNYSPTSNYMMVADPVQDAATSYVYSSTVGQSDLYGISSISSTPASIVAVTTRGYLQKSDAGTRNTSVQLKSGGTTVQSTSAALGTTWGWQYRVDTTDPATGAAWTAVGVANAQIGVVLQA